MMKKYFLFDDENINGTTFLQRHFFIFLLPIFIYSTSRLQAYFVPELNFDFLIILNMITLVYLLPMFYMLSVLSFKRSKTLGHNIILRLFISLLYPFFFFGALSPDKPEDSFIIIISIPIVIFIFLWLGIYSKNKNFGFSNEYPSIINKVNCKNLRFLNVFTKKVNYKNSKFLDWILKRKKNIVLSVLIIFATKILIHYFFFRSTFKNSKRIHGVKYEPIIENDFGYHIEACFDQYEPLFIPITIIYLLLVWIFNDKIKAK